MTPVQILAHSSFHSVSLQESEFRRKNSVSSLMAFNLEGQQPVLNISELEKVLGHAVLFSSYTQWAWGSDYGERHKCELLPSLLEHLSAMHCTFPVLTAILLFLPFHRTKECLRSSIGCVTIRAHYSRYSGAPLGQLPCRQTLKSMHYRGIRSYTKIKSTSFRSQSLAMELRIT